jgi:hypothetical protein
MATFQFRCVCQQEQWLQSARSIHWKRMHRSALITQWGNNEKMIITGTISSQGDALKTQTLQTMLCGEKARMTVPSLQSNST